ncbi:MAG TPA: peptidylprolyl isomerase, partial [Actinomycetota bacterium]|nr:peptidylprolyl isomerase [Actinomycetota bacterium]
LLASVLVGAAGCSLARPDVARVGEREVQEAQLERATDLQAVLAQLQGAPCGQPAQGESEDAACRRAALSSELLWLAVEGYAREHDLVAEGRQVREAVDQLEAQVGADVLDDALASRSVDRGDLDALGRRILTVRAVRTAVAEDRLDDGELRAAYEERIREFTFLDADHILVETHAQAEDVYRRVRDATEERFMAVARRESIEPGADSTGGGLGRTAASGFVGAFADAALALQPGEVSPPVQTEFGWHVIYLVDRTVTPYEEARASLVEPMADAEFQAWLEERAAALDVEVNPRYGRFEPRTFSVRPVTSTDPEAATPAAAP